VPAKSLHVTLCFLGWTPEKRIPECEEALGQIAPRPVPMRLEPEPVALPKRRPRLFALDAPSDAATALAGEVSDALEAKQLYEPEKRPFWSHVTVARVRAKKGEKGVRVKPPAPLDPAACEPFEAVRLTFYRSNLSSHGAEYVPLASTDLPPA
jgi:2'-5' RNA ligase